MPNSLISCYIGQHTGGSGTCASSMYLLINNKSTIRRMWPVSRNPMELSFDNVTPPRITQREISIGAVRHREQRFAWKDVSLDLQNGQPFLFVYQIKPARTFIYSKFSILGIARDEAALESWTFDATPGSFGELDIKIALTGAFDVLTTTNVSQFIDTSGVDGNPGKSPHCKEFETALTEWFNLRRDDEAVAHISDYVSRETLRPAITEINRETIKDIQVSTKPGHVIRRVKRVRKIHK